jgi:DNA excision repair protein ERCC-2
VNHAVAKPVHAVQVRELVAFVLRSGDLASSHQFVGPDRALAGIRGHQKIQRTRPAGYATEIPVEHSIETDLFTLRVRGRIDGLLATPQEVLLEEIKTVQGVRDHQPDPLHWAQAKFYGFIHAHLHALDRLTLQLTYLELATDEVTELRQVFFFAELSEFFTSTTAVYLDWLREHYQWRAARDQSIHALEFPFSQYRPGQRELAVAAYRTLANGGKLFLAAPTGIGKTISVLFPALKALAEGKLERIFYLTARTVGRAIAAKALADLRQGGLKLRAVTLTAREKVCVRDGHPCDALTCPLALGYYDRLKPALREALWGEFVGDSGRASLGPAGASPYQKSGDIDRSALEAVAQKHQVCPYELALDVSDWADAVICDYNYVFDPQVYLRRHFAEGGGQFAFLVDEAHNLVDRAREMFSADLDSQEIATVRRAVQPAAPRCAKALTRLNTAIRKLTDPSTTNSPTEEFSDQSTELNLFPSPPTLASNEARSGVRTSAELPGTLLLLLEAALAEMESWLVQNRPAPFREDLLTLYFHLRSFQRTAELYDEHYVTILENEPAARLRLFCVDPSSLLRQALARGSAAIFFSATLTPIDYYFTLLGGEPGDPILQLPSPFPSENLAVLIEDRIKTDLKGRAESIGQVVAAIETLVQGRRGNYLVYFPSYQYLNDVLREFQARCPSVNVLVQRPGMTEPERDAFLAAFSAEHGETLAGFAVLGGIFGEGIDLVGDRLIGAVIVGVGLPQLCLERDLIKNHFAARKLPGFDYAYTFPGMNRVLQAVGRVVRSDTDLGAVLLIDARFHEPRYRRLFPPWWRFLRVRNPASLRSAIERFWNPSI